MRQRTFRCMTCGTEITTTIPSLPLCRKDKTHPMKMVAVPEISERDNYIMPVKIVTMNSEWVSGECGHNGDPVDDGYDFGDTEPCVHCGDPRCVATVTQKIVSQ